MAYSEAKRDFLVETASRWVPQLSVQLSIAKKTYPVLVHGIPTSFDPLNGSDDVHHLISQNDHLIVCPLVLQHTEFLSWTHAASQCKSWGSLIMYLTDAQITNDCIVHHIAYWSRLLLTVKFTCHPPQCYKCHRFGHLSQSCKASITCGCCAGTHATCDCRCPATTECVEPTPCRHIQLRCAACAGLHPVSYSKCPARWSSKRVWRKLRTNM